MRKRVIWIALVVVGVVGVSTTIAVASGDSEGGVTGPQADRAIEAALDATGGGTANAVEHDNEGGATWEVEVTRPDGITVDVRLDEQFQVIGTDGDSESGDAESGENESGDAEG